MCLGDCVERLFHDANTTPGVISHVFHVRTNHWPVEELENRTLGSTQQVAAQYKKEDTPPMEKIVSFITAHFDALVVGGSYDSVMDQALPYLDTLLLVVKQIVNQGFPFLGICFGAQALAVAMYGRKAVRKMEKKEYGFKRFTVLDQKNALFNKIPLHFVSASSHEDCFEGEGLETICSSTTWKNQGFQIQDKPAWGVQFHPEFLESDAMKIFEKVKHRGDPLEHDEDSTQDAIGAQIAQNFVSICASVRNGENIKSI